MALQRPAGASGKPLIDEANDMIRPGPSELTTAVVTAPDGSKLVGVTIRTGDVTLTVFVEPGQARAWGEQLAGESARAGAPALVRVQGPLDRLLGANGT